MKPLASPAHTFASSIEPLEARIAPASLTGGGKLLTYMDLDGDTVKVAFTQPILAGEVAFTTGTANDGADTPRALNTINLSTHPGIGFTLTATPHAGHGDSHANIVSILGSGTDLGSISVDGDVRYLSAGSGAPGTVGLKSFTALSMGRDYSGTVTNSSLQNVASFNVKSDVINEQLQFTGGLRSITIGGNLAETLAGASAQVSVTGGVGTLKIGGSIIADSGGQPNLKLLGPTNPKLPCTIQIGGSVIGGTANGALDQLQLDVNVKSLTIGGDVRGRSGRNGGTIGIGGSVGTVKIGGSLIGPDNGEVGGVLQVDRNAGSITIGRDLRGGDNSTNNFVGPNGQVFVLGNLASFKLGGDLIAGKKLGSGGIDEDGALVVGGSIGSVLIGGSVLGDASHTAAISAGAGGTTGAVAAIKSLTVKGSVQYARIFTGYNAINMAENTDSGIGSIVIGGNLSGSQIIIGSDTGVDGIPGTADDFAISTVATIGSVKVGGAFTGIAGDATRYYIYGPVIKTVTIGHATYTASQLAETPTFFETIGVAEIYSVV